MTTAITDPTASALPRADAGLVVSVRVSERHTHLDYAVGDGLDTVRLPVRPDVEAARRLAATVRRVCWVALTVHDDGCVEADLSAIGHRVPLRRGISVATALGLARQQVPVVVHRHEGVRR